MRCPSLRALQRKPQSSPDRGCPSSPRGLGLRQYHVHLTNHGEAILADRDYTSDERTDDRSRSEGSGRGSGSRDRRSGGGRPRGGGGRRPYGSRRRRTCQFCENDVKQIDYKNVSLLNRYVAPSGHILSRRKVGTCAKHQRMLSRAIKRAREIALLPFTAEHGRRGIG
ncbi:MAG: 30S ribosomal protein S18 [Anaerolineae bacterium]|nr:30S ribosomal protein S18 [Anaerolineae bacterium]